MGLPFGGKLTDRVRNGPSFSDEPGELACDFICIIASGFLSDLDQNSCAFFAGGGMGSAG